MLKYVHGRAEPVSTQDREKIAQQARVPTQAGWSFTRSHTPQHGHIDSTVKARSEKSFLAASDYTDTSTNVSVPSAAQRQSTSHDNYANGHGLDATQNTDHFSERSIPSDAQYDDAMASSDAGGEQDDEHANPGYNSEDDDVIIGLVKDELDAVYPTPDAESYPDTTSGHLTNARHSQPEASPEADIPARTPAAEIDLIQPARSRFMAASRVPREGIAGAALDAFATNTEFYANAHKQQNVSNYHTLQQERLHMQRQSLVATAKGKRPLDIERTGSTALSIRSLPTADNHRAQSVPADINQHSQASIFLNSSSPRRRQTNGTRHNGELGSHQGLQSTDTTEEVFPENFLDYDTSELFKMDYAKLQEESFDVSAPIPVGTEQVELSIKLEQMLRKNANLQYDFLSSLPMSDWEESGKWFSSRIAELMSKVQQSRQGRRTLAKQFEDEIDRRHETIVRQQQELEETLKGMRNNGSKVLQLRGSHLQQ